MRRRRQALGIGLAAAAAILGGVGLQVRADDPPPPAAPAKQSWFGFWGKQAPEAQKDSAGNVVTSASTHADSKERRRAERDWKRRAEICQKLREIAASAGDADLERFAERLDQRAWDVYLRQTSTLPMQPAPDSMHGVRVDIDAGPTAAPMPRPNDKIYEVRP